MQRKNVISSDIKSIGYDETSCILEIEFNSVSVYQYYNVPRSVYIELMNATSHGKYFHRYIKDVYPVKRIS